MEAEYVALSMAMRDLLPFKKLVHTIFTGLGLERNQQFSGVYLKRMQEHFL